MVLFLLLFCILELSVGMTTEGIEVRSVGNTKVHCQQNGHAILIILNNVTIVQFSVK